MKVFVKFYSHLGDLIDKKTKLDFEIDKGATINRLLDELVIDTIVKDHLLNKNSQLKSSITILANRREIKFLDGLETILDSYDEISIFPIVAGGYI